jgi:hypothetical protein
LANGGHRDGATAASTLLAPGHHPTYSDDKHLAAEMTAALFAELERSAAVGPVADIVAGVMDEDRRSAQDLAAQSAMIATRKRLERLLRAGSSRPKQSNDARGGDQTRHQDPVGELRPAGAVPIRQPRGCERS